MTHGERKLVACGSEDHHVYLWDLQSRQARGAWWAAGHAVQAVSRGQAACLYARLPRAAASPTSPLALRNATQIAGILRGRPSQDAPVGGHCATVLTVDAALEAGCLRIASGGQKGDGSVKLWQHESMGAAAAAGGGGVARMET